MEYDARDSHWAYDIWQFTRLSLFYYHFYEGFGVENKDLRLLVIFCISCDDRHNIVVFDCYEMLDRVFEIFEVTIYSIFDVGS